MTKHIHAELMLEYAKDAMETETPWDKWEYCSFHAVGWEDCMTTPTWWESNKYRRKTVNINGHEVPEPCRKEPLVGERYCIPNILSNVLFDEFIWRRDTYDYNHLNLGLIHLTKEAAIAHAEALLSFTKETDK